MPGWLGTRGRMRGRSQLRVPGGSQPRARCRCMRCGGRGCGLGGERGDRSTTGSAEESVGSGCPCQKEAVGHPTRLAMGCKGRGDGGAWRGAAEGQGQRRRGGPVCARGGQAAGCKIWHSGWGRHRCGSVLTAVGGKMSPGREVVDRGPEAR